MVGWSENSLTYCFDNNSDEKQWKKGRKTVIEVVEKCHVLVHSSTSDGCCILWINLLPLFCPPHRQHNSIQLLRKNWQTFGHFCPAFWPLLETPILTVIINPTFPAGIINESVVVSIQCCWCRHDLFPSITDCATVSYSFRATIEPFFFLTTMMKGGPFIHSSIHSFIDSFIYSSTPSLLFILSIFYYDF